jgi:uncharacterized delta-60 repeat protein
LIQARDTGGSDSTGADVAIGPDNAIYVAGTADDAQHHIAMLLMKFTASGEPDYQFGTNGIKRFQVATPVDASYGYSFAQDVVLQPDGKILLIGGTRENATDGQGVVLRVLPNGNLDPSFGSNGIVRLALAGAGGPRAETFAYGGAVADGRLFMTGSIDDTTTRGYVARILLDALPDPAPGGPGQPGGGAGGGTPPGGGGTIPVAPRGVLKLAASSLSVDSHGRVHLPLTCSATGPCTGKVLVVASDGTVVLPTASKARRAVTYAAGAYALKAGAKKTLVLKLRTKGRSALRGHHKLTVRLVLAPTGQKATTKRIKLVAPKRR